jgi:hypothetical protein
MKQSFRPSIASIAPIAPSFVPTNTTVYGTADRPGRAPDPHTTAFMASWNGTSDVTTDVTSDVTADTPAAEMTREDLASSERRFFKVGDPADAAADEMAREDLAPLEQRDARSADESRVPWAEASRRERERRVADLVLDGHSIPDARRLAPTVPARPDAIAEMINAPMAAEELAAAELLDVAELAASRGAEHAAKYRARMARQDAADPVYAAGRGRLARSMFYRTLDRDRRLRAAGVRFGDLDTSRPEVRPSHEVPWADASPCERERRVGDLVIVGHSVDDARRLAPVLAAQPDAILAAIGQPLTPADAAEMAAIDGSVGAFDVTDVLDRFRAYKRAPEWTGGDGVWRAYASHSLLQRVKIRGSRLMVAGVRPGDLDVDRPYTPPAWRQAWSECSPEHREWRVGDMVLSGRSIFDARAAAPTTTERPIDRANDNVVPGDECTPRAERLEMRGVKPGDLDLCREYDPTTVVRDADGAVSYILPGATDREHSRRTGDLVMAGYSLADARRLAPTTPTPHYFDALIDVPLTPAELAHARACEFAEHAQSDGPEVAARRMADYARDRAETIARKAEADRSCSPETARARAEHSYALVDALMYRQFDRRRRLSAAGVHRVRDSDVYCPSALRPPRATL